MAQRSRPTVTKRQREQARIAKQKEKAAKRAEKSQKDREDRSGADGVDPDLAGIRPGPQPPAWWQVDEKEEEPEEK